MLAVQFADFGFGTVVGTVVTGSIAIFLDQRRRKDEKKSRFLAEKRLMYRNVLQIHNALADDIALLARMEPFFARLEELEPEAHELLKQAAIQFSRRVAKTQEQYRDHRDDFAVLGSRASGVAAIKVSEVIQRMLNCIISGEPEKVAELREEYDLASRDFLLIVRQDLEIDT
jgi:hypothetical protein